MDQNDTQSERGCVMPQPAKTAWWPAFATASVIVLSVVAWELVVEPKQRERARRSLCAHNLRCFGVAATMYSRDYGCFPLDLVDTTPGYLANPGNWKCRSTQTERASSLEQLRTGKYSDYAYFGGGLPKDLWGCDPEKTILACDKLGNHKQFFNVLVATGHYVPGGFEDDSIEEIADKNGFFLPGYNTPEKGETGDGTTPE